MTMHDNLTHLQHFLKHFGILLVLHVESLNRNEKEKYAKSTINKNYKKWVLFSTSLIKKMHNL